MLYQRCTTLEINEIVLNPMFSSIHTEKKAEKKCPAEKRKEIGKKWKKIAENFPPSNTMYFNDPILMGRHFWNNSYNCIQTNKQTYNTLLSVRFLLKIMPAREDK